jgi:exodeoxyribonuclease VII small subunit
VTPVPAPDVRAPAPPAGEARGYEEARDELVEIVRHLEQGGLSLEESLALWERGEALAAACQAWLDGARARLDAVMAGEHDKPAEGEVGDDGEDDSEDEDDADD